MCLSRPGRVIAVAGGRAEVEAGGRRVWFNSLMVPEAQAGDWVLTHTGLVVGVIGEAQAAEAEQAYAEAAGAGHGEAEDRA